MSLYHVLFGVEHATAGAILLGLLGFRSTAEVGRYRDAWVEADAAGKPVIAVYTRNGSGNRECWCSPWGDPERCWADHSFSAPEAETTSSRRVRRTIKTTSDHGLTTWSRHPDGGHEEKLAAVCLFPDSASCACPGCIASYRLPAHPLYVRDSDDEFDGTYATFYFRAPESCREVLGQIAGEHVDMSEVWMEMLDHLKESLTPTEEAS
jgi:hypothetical protein